MKITELASFALALAFATACAGTETTNPLHDFAGSDCKMHLLGNGDIDVSALALSQEDDGGVSADDAGTGVLPDGGAPAVVSCVSYEQSASTLHVSALNFRAPCGIEVWQGSASFEGELLKLESKNANRDCAIAACGYCIYDLTFEIENTMSGPLPVELGVGGCVGGDDVNRLETKLELPLDEAKSGTVCRDAAGHWTLKK